MTSATRVRHLSQSSPLNRLEPVTGGAIPGRIVKMGSVPSLDRFQAQAIWEMSAQSY